MAGDNDKRGSEHSQKYIKTSNSLGKVKWPQGHDFVESENLIFVNVRAVEFKNKFFYFRE